MHSVQRRSSCLFFEGFHVHFGQTALLQTFCHPVFFFLVQRQNRFPHQAAGEYTALYQSFLQTGMGFAGRLAAAVDGLADGINVVGGILGFPGAVLAVSHDRYFLDKMAQSIFEVEEDGRVVRYEGDYAAYAAKRAEQQQQAKLAQKPAAKQSAERSERARPAKLKFTFKEQKEYEEIDGRIADLEARLQVCARAMAAAASD